MRQLLRFPIFGKVTTGKKKNVRYLRGEKHKNSDVRQSPEKAVSLHNLLVYLLIGQDGGQKRVERNRVTWPFVPASPVQGQVVTGFCIIIFFFWGGGRISSEKLLLLCVCVCVCVADFVFVIYRPFVISFDSVHRFSFAIVLASPFFSIHRLR